MPQQDAGRVQGTDGIHAETKDRDPSFIMSGHHCHELYYVHSGSCRFLIGDSFRDLKAGDMVLIPPMELHYTRYLFGPCVRTVVLFRREDVGEDLSALTPRAERFMSEGGVFHIPLDSTAPVNGFLRQLTAEEKARDPFSLPPGTRRTGYARGRSSRRRNTSASTTCIPSPLPTWPGP